MAATKGIPIAAFPGQDHEAHIKVKMAYMQDPANGANPIMQRIVPILQANIQEHSVMKYQEQMSGVTQQMAQGSQDPAVIEQAMAQAAQQVMQANQMAAQNMGQSIEQQTINLQKDQLMLEKEKLDIEAMKDAADLEIKNRQITLKESELKVKTISEGAVALMKSEEREQDRALQQTNDTIKVLTDVAKATLEDETKKQMKLAGIQADFAKQEMKTERDIELENIKTHRDERLEGEE